MWRSSRSAARLLDDRERGTEGAGVERGGVERRRVGGSAQRGRAAGRVALVATADLGEDAGQIRGLAALDQLVVAPRRPLLGGRRDEVLAGLAASVRNLAGPSVLENGSPGTLHTAQQNWPYAPEPKPARTYVPAVEQQDGYGDSWLARYRRQCKELTGLRRGSRANDRQIKLLRGRSRLSETAAGWPPNASVQPNVGPASAEV
jgi:hypothetical protein